MAPRTENGLPPKRAAFVREYLIDLNATRAATRAGYSVKTAKSQGQRLLTNVDVAAAIEAGKAARVQRTEITADRVLAELARIAFSDPRRWFDEQGNLFRPTQLSDDVAAALASVEVVTRGAGQGEVEYVSKIKAWDKLRALEMLCKHLGIARERIDLNLISDPDDEGL